MTYKSDKDAVQISPPMFSGTGHGTGTSLATDAGFMVYSPVRLPVSRIDGLTSWNHDPRLSVRREGDENVFTLAIRGKLIALVRKPAKYHLSPHPLGARQRLHRSLL